MMIMRMKVNLKLTKHVSAEKMTLIPTSRQCYMEFSKTNGLVWKDTFLAFITCFLRINENEETIFSNRLSWKSLSIFA